MLLTLALTLALQQGSATVTIGARDSAAVRTRRAQRDTLAAKADSIRKARESAMAKWRASKRIALTPALLASAYRDDMARTLVQRARATRLRQDSTLTSYDATTYERLSLGLQITSMGHERLMLRDERATRVRWSRERGAVVDVTGKRAVSPMIGQDGDVRVETGQWPIPYVPGQETLWIGSELAKANVSDTDIFNPLAEGAEAYYTYATGDSASFKLAGRDRVVVRELRVRPRAPMWNAIVGSLWFDSETGHLVRAVYRLAEPIDIVQLSKEQDDEDIVRDVPFLLRPMLFPMSARVSVITIDYGLFEGRFWLPRTQTLEGSATLGVFHAPASIEQRFDYADVNGTVDIPTLALLPSDTATTVDAYRARRLAADSACRNGAKERVQRTTGYDNTLVTLIRVPCDTVALAHASTLPSSPYDRVDSLFNSDEREDLIARVLGMETQAGIAPRPATWENGLQLARYNRVEGVSLGAKVSKVFGAGYSGAMLVRGSAADRTVNGELSLTRDNGRATRTLSVYRRLAADNDWDNPLGLSASLSALLFGRDQGMYYRAWGGEIVGTSTNGLADTWRLFSEQEWTADKRTSFSLARAIHGDSFDFRPNLVAARGTVTGLALRRRGILGENPRGARLASDFRVEGAAGTFDYVRGMLDLTLSRPLTRGLASALTLSGGTSGGTLPPQRLWYLGGMRTLAGQPVGVLAGNAYWLTRLELGASSVVARPILFGDIGWAGDRSRLTEGVRPASSVGIGSSFLDGLLRIDVARGIRPERGVRAYVYLDARF